MQLEKCIHLEFYIGARQVHPSLDEDLHSYRRMLFKGNVVAMGCRIFARNNLFEIPRIH